MTAAKRKEVQKKADLMEVTCMLYEVEQARKGKEIYYFVRTVENKETIQGETIEQHNSYIISSDSFSYLELDQMYEQGEIDRIIPLRVFGRTYSERKQSLIDFVLDFQAADEGGLSYEEIARLENFLRANAKRYGLIREFEDNAII